MNKPKARSNPAAEIEARVLHALYKLHGVEGFDLCFPIAPIAEQAGVPKEYARTALKELRNRGFVTYERGLFNEDGLVAGSGYRMTLRGREAVERSLAKVRANIEIINGPPYPHFSPRVTT